MSKAKQQERREVIVLLTERFPQCFSVDGPRKPLKVGIYADIVAALDGAVTPEQLRRGLAAYTGVAGYLRGIVPGASRFDLDGKAAGVVTFEEAAAAKGTMARKLRPAPAMNPETPLVPVDEPKLRPDSAPPSVPTGPKRLSLADLREAARRRRETT